MTKFIALFDVHWGFERRGGHKVPLHDPKAIAAVVKFAKEYRPDVVILGGDILDCGGISHHARHKPGAIEGLRLVSDASELRESLLAPLEALKPKRLVYHIGNHEDWLNQLTDELPGLEGIIDAESILGLDKWEVIPQGQPSYLDKLVFIHGDQLSGGDHCAKAAVIANERNVRFGHFHTYQVYTKTSALDIGPGRSGVAVPCLCKRGPGYGKGAANKWTQGFLYGVTNGKGPFEEHIAFITNGEFLAGGKLYKG